VSQVLAATFGAIAVAMSIFALIRKRFGLARNGAAKIGPLSRAEVARMNVCRFDSPVRPVAGVQCRSSGETERSVREAHYASTRHLMLVHAFVPSSAHAGEYDIVVYLKGHERVLRDDDGLQRTTAVGDLTVVSQVAYYFGGRFGSQDGMVLQSSNATNNFAVVIGAYGSTLCYAQIHFKDGTVEKAFRYLDFEMKPAANAAADSERMLTA